MSQENFYALTKEKFELLANIMMLYSMLNPYCDITNITLDDEVTSIISEIKAKESQILQLFKDVLISESGLTQEEKYHFFCQTNIPEATNTKNNPNCFHLGTIALSELIDENKRVQALTLLNTKGESKQDFWPTLARRSYFHSEYLSVYLRLLKSLVKDFPEMVLDRLEKNSFLFDGSCLIDKKTSNSYFEILENLINHNSQKVLNLIQNFFITIPSDYRNTPLGYKSFRNGFLYSEAHYKTLGETVLNLLMNGGVYDIADLVEHRNNVVYGYLLKLDSNPSNLRLLEQCVGKGGPTLLSGYFNSGLPSEVAQIMKKITTMASHLNPPSSNSQSTVSSLSAQLTGLSCHVLDISTTELQMQRSGLFALYADSDGRSIDRTEDQCEFLQRLTGLIDEDSTTVSAFLEEPMDADMPSGPTYLGHKMMEQNFQTRAAYWSVLARLMEKDPEKALGLLELRNGDDERLVDFLLKRDAHHAMAHYAEFLKKFPAKYGPDILKHLQSGNKNGETIEYVVACMGNASEMRAYLSLIEGIHVSLQPPAAASAHSNSSSTNSQNQIQDTLSMQLPINRILKKPS